MIARNWRDPVRPPAAPPQNPDADPSDEIVNTALNTPVRMVRMILVERSQPLQYRLEYPHRQDSTEMIATFDATRPDIKGLRVGWRQRFMQLTRHPFIPAKCNHIRYLPWHNKLPQPCSRLCAICLQRWTILRIQHVNVPWLADAGDCSWIGCWISSGTLTMPTCIRVHVCSTGFRRMPSRFNSINGGRLSGP